jgi:hypothetical protein
MTPEANLDQCVAPQLFPPLGATFVCSTIPSGGSAARLGHISGRQVCALFFSDRVSLSQRAVMPVSPPVGSGNVRGLLGVALRAA